MKNNDLEKVDNKKEKIDVNKNIETKVVLERRKPSVFLSVILILIGAVITALIFLIFFGDRIVNEKNQEVQEENVADNESTEVKEVVKEVRKLNLNVDGDFITFLYGKLTTFNTFLPLVYNTDKTTFDSLSDNNKLLYTLNNSKRTKINLSQVSSKLDNKMSYTEQEIARYYAEKIEIKNASKKYKSIYGEDKEIPLIDADNGMGYVYEYVPEDNCFYGHSYMGGGGSSFTYKTNITKCESNEEGTEVYIYEDFIAMNQTKTSSEGNLWTVYSDSSQSNIVKDDVLETYSNGNSLLENMSKDEFLNKYLESDGVNYKHTFKLDDSGNYYWYSTEVNK